MPAGSKVRVRGQGMRNSRGQTSDLYLVVEVAPDPVYEPEIVADGRRLKVTLNGTVLVDANLDDAKDPEVLKKHPGLARTTGHIGLLGHGTRVEFRNLRVKELK